MPITEQEKLISETLHYRPSSGCGCFVVNEPGLRLISSDASFLPYIKSTLLEAAQDGNRRQRSHGVDYVIGALLVLSTKHDPEHLVPFIQSFPQWFQKEVLSTIPVFFQKNKTADGYNFLVAPPRDLIEFVRRVSHNEDPELSKTAQRVLRML